MRGRGTSRSWATDLVVLVVIIEVKESTCSVVECIPTVSLRCCACEIQEFEFCVRVPCSCAGGAHLTMIFCDVAEFVSHAKT